VVLYDARHTIELDDIRSHLIDQSIASYKLPERLVIVPSLRRNPLGKVVKDDLRKSLRDSLDYGLISNEEPRATRP
jgi:non-ribosomal peptide synthetase component E (peptide arylation enzyme)